MKNPTTPKKRGRPAKDTTPQAAPEAASKPSVQKTDNEPTALAEALTTALRPLIDELKAHILIAARIAAADTLHSMQSTDMVLKQSITEGRLAAILLSPKEA